MAWLAARDKRLTIHYGRIEPRQIANEAARDLREYLGSLKIRIDQSVYKDLQQLAKRHAKLSVAVEKAVDVMIAVDMVEMAIRNEYDTAFLLSADGDFTPVVEAVKNKDKRVIAVSLGHGAELAKSAHAYLHLEARWVSDCFGE